MSAKTLVFPCLNCGRDTGCVNRLVCPDCRNDTASMRSGVRQRSNLLAGKKIARETRQWRRNS
jgi:hypothetical protein